MYLEPLLQEGHPSFLSVGELVGEAPVPHQESQRLEHKIPRGQRSEVNHKTQEVESRGLQGGGLVYLEGLQAGLLHGQSAVLREQLG